MRGVHIDQFGEPATVVSTIDKEKPTPGAGQVLVRMLMAPINPSDLHTIRGTYTKIPKLPFAPGYEGVGVVESAGPGMLGRFYIGKRVSLLTADGGTWQQYTVAPARQVVPVSSQIPVEQAAMFFVNPTTAYVLTRDLLAVPSGQWLLQTAAGSALGRMVIKLGQKFGFRTINVVRRSEQAREILEAGGDEAIATDDQDLEDRIRQITGGAGVHYAIDCVSGELGSKVVRCLGQGGKLLVFGTMSGQPLSFSSRDLMTPASNIQGFWLGNHMSSLSLVSKLRTIYRVGKLIQEGVLASPVGNVFPLDDVRSAVQDAERSARGGKTLLRIGNS